MINRNPNPNPNLKSRYSARLRLGLGLGLRNDLRGVLGAGKVYFNHEKLDAYRAALEFAAWAGDVTEQLPARLSIRNQLDRASSSAVLNIAEGNAKFSPRDRRRYFEIALGSALECAACMDILLLRKQLTSEQAHVGKSKIQRIAATVMGLIRSTEKQLGEESPDYIADSPE